MRNISPTVVNTWLYLRACTDPKLAKARFSANSQIMKYFGSSLLAKLYIEKCKDEQIDVYLI